eukprot:5634226-Pyramimonas_sp.AAC.1
MPLLLSSRLGDYVNLDQGGVIHAIRCGANAKMRSLSEAAQTLVDDDAFKPRMDTGFSDLTTIAAQCQGAGGRSDMLIMPAEK